jgi:hypothetical protein
MQTYFKFSLKKNTQITLGFFGHMQEKNIFLFLFFYFFLGFV